MNRKMTIANLITMGRILLAPIFLVILLTEMEHKEIIAFFVFLLASLTDAVDGYFARKFNQITNLGKFLDPLADKILVAGALLALVYLEYVAAWVAAIIIFREIFILGFRLYFLVKDSSFSASWLAKKKTLVQVIGISIVIIHPKLPYPEFFLELGTAVLYIAVILAIYSAVEYIVIYTRNSKETDAV
jgi:CDP-diacylglycerol---glycerol-3-phosphate 3-phosphatidyltransferase